MPVGDLLRLAIVISAQQVYTRLRRSIAAFAGIAGGIVLVLMQLGFQSALYESAVRLHRNLNGELVVIAREFRSIQDPTWFPLQWLVMARAHPFVDTAAPLYISPVRIRSVDDHTVRTLLGIGIELDRPALSLNNLDATGDTLRMPGYALFDRKSKSSYGDVIGRLRRDGSVQIETAIVASPLQSRLTIIGTYALGGTIVYYGTALMSAETLSNITAQPLQRVNMGVLKLRAGADPQTVAQQLGSVLPPEAKVLTAEQFIELERQFWRNETPIGFLFDTGAAIGFLISAIYIYQVLFQITDENLPEYAVLQSMGYPSWFFAVLIASTSLILAAAALPPAAILAAVLYRVCVAATTLDLQLTATRILTVGGLAALMAIGSASVANRRLRHADPAALM